MKRFIRFGKIGQLRDVIRNFSSHVQYVGIENGEAKYDSSIKLPTVKIIASEKIHGTNAGVCFSAPDGFWIQSRRNIITPEKDNHSCALNATHNQETWMNIIQHQAKVYDIDLNENIISIFFEWSGQGIQKNSALTGLSKRSMIFQHFKVSPILEQSTEDGNDENSSSSYWLEIKDFDSSANEVGIYSIMDFPTYSFDIDFSNPKLSVNSMIQLVEEIIEPNSPVGKQFDIENNVGEGIVCTFMWENILYRFKVKGEKHSATKVKTLTPVDEEKERVKIEFANLVCSASRLEQAWDECFHVGQSEEIENKNRKHTGSFIRLVMNDILAEEVDIMMERKLEVSDIKESVGNISRKWFFEQIDANVGLI